MDYRTLLLARAHAKVNLALSVGPRGDEGLHPVASWSACVELHDDISYSRLLPGDTSRYQVVTEHDAPRPAPVDWPIDEDLAVRAHRLLERAAGRDLPVRITVRKRIPVRGGLGGGSADAGATLVGLTRMFGLDFSAARLAELSRELGSDVAFYIDEAMLEGSPGPPRPAVVSGTGERVERVSRPQAALVLLIPPFGCATAEVYRAYDGLGPGPLREAEVRALAGAGAPDPAMLFNDLERAAEQVEPRLADLRRRAREIGGRPVHMSGAGSTLFVIADPTGPGTPDALAARLRNGLPGVAVVPTRLV